MNLSLHICKRGWEWYILPSGPESIQEHNPNVVAHPHHDEGWRDELQGFLLTMPRQGKARVQPPTQRMEVITFRGSINCLNASPHLGRSSSSICHSLFLLAFTGSHFFFVCSEFQLSVSLSISASP